jgi:hypothetical protein
LIRWGGEGKEGKEGGGRWRQRERERGGEEGKGRMEEGRGGVGGGVELLL